MALTILTTFWSGTALNVPYKTWFKFQQNIISKNNSLNFISKHVLTSVLTTTVYLESYFYKVVHVQCSLYYNKNKFSTAAALYK